ncbi:hypothetical protein [Acinetobacter sp. ANC 4648]|uniref:hypothetical protein n=1 Tax=Acinetobacter sp. ANC 4648 TaxID=1977875 RepID=UPI000A352B1D|nr:hypothetical protein [Acinetobacter sp. ANC 4648]OTG81038.1 hypothetical protein B9T27_11265 [Acinetobacter sp. ANC 4648]
MNGSSSEHEVLNCFQTQLTPLSDNLTEMLNEHFSHQTERRGCGFTQATRVIAEFINLAADETDFKDFKIFSNYDTKRLRTILSTAKSYGLELKTWRNLDLNHEVQLFLAQKSQNNLFYNTLAAEVQSQSQLRSIAQGVKLEESKLICDFLEDIILRKHDSTLIELKSLVEKPKVGSCPMAENFFLKIAHRKFLRHGLINIFVNDQNQPILIEKVKMGDDHSCINLVPLIMNGIRIPEGSLFSVRYNEDTIQKIANKTYKGFVIPLSEVDGFWFLRLTTLAISPENRQRAFTSHFKQQIDNGLFSPGTTQLAQLKSVALEQI